MAVPPHNSPPDRLAWPQGWRGPQVVMADPFADSAPILRAMLAAIGVNGRRVWLGRDGRWQMAPARPWQPEEAPTLDGAWCGILDATVPCAVHGRLVAAVEADRPGLPWIMCQSGRRDHGMRMQGAGIPSIRVIAKLQAPWGTSALSDALDAARSAGLPMPRATPVCAIGRAA